MLQYYVINNNMNEPNRNWIVEHHEEDRSPVILLAQDTPRNISYSYLLILPCIIEYRSLVPMRSGVHTPTNIPRSFKTVLARPSCRGTVI